MMVGEPFWMREPDPPGPGAGERRACSGGVISPKFEAEVFPHAKGGIRYGAGADSGWLLVQAEDAQSTEFSIPTLLQANVTAITKDRGSFTLLEGPLAGRRGSIRLRNGVSSLASIPISRAPALGVAIP